MKVDINYIKTEPDISREGKVLLEKTVEKHAQLAGKILNVPHITITVYPKSSWTIPETGESGYTFSEDWIRISVDPKSQKFSLKEIIEKHIPATIYHEINHAARWRSVYYGTNLFEAIISEGLACVFGKEQWLAFTAPWTTYSDKEIANLLDMIQKRDKSLDGIYNHAEWFHGKGKLPRWIGYKLGAYIIEVVRKNFPKIGWEELTEMKAKDIIKTSGIKI